MPDVIPYALDPAEPPTPQLVHFVGRPRGGVLLPELCAHLTAEQRLASILESGQLLAFPVPGTERTPVISVSDTSPADLDAALRVGLNSRGSFEPWGLVLHRESMWSAGARPVVYSDHVHARLIRKSLEDWSAGAGALVQRVDLQMYRSDWTHEREWRWIPPADRDHLPVWPQLNAVIVGRMGWQPPSLDTHRDAARVQRWWWTGKELVDDGLIAEPSPYE